MMQRFDSVSGFVLAGGSSSRMGQPKQNLVLGPETMLERQVRMLRSVCRDVSVVGPAVEPGPESVRFLPDVFPGCGPLGGIHAALAACRTEVNLIVACDLPFLDPRFFRDLLRYAMDSEADVTIPEDKAHRTVPVCAVYRRRIQAIIRARLAQGLNKADGYFRSVRVRQIPWSYILSAGFSSHIFDNINRPDEFKAVQERLRF